MYFIWLSRCVLISVFLSLLLTCALKRIYASWITLCEAIWSGILNSILLNDPMKTYTLYFLTFTFSFLNQKIILYFWEISKILLLEHDIILCFRIRTRILRWHFSHILMKHVISVFKQFHWFIFLKRKIRREKAGTLPTILAIFFRPKVSLIHLSKLMHK